MPDEEEGARTRTEEDAPEGAPEEPVTTAETPEAFEAEAVDDAPTDDEALAEMRDAVDAAEARAEEAAREAADLRNRFARLQADFQNYRKRMQREQQEIRERATESLLTELLGVLDNFERALADPGDGAELLDGLKLIHKQMENVLTLQGLERVQAVGQAFDPNLHEAIAREPSAEYPADTVAREFQAGYTLKGRVLRPARVVVSSGAPDADAEADTTGGADAQESPEKGADGRKAQKREATKQVRESGADLGSHEDAE